MDFFPSLNFLSYKGYQINYLPKNIRVLDINNSKGGENLTDYSATLRINDLRCAQTKVNVKEDKIPKLNFEDITNNIED